MLVSQYENLASDPLWIGLGLCLHIAMASAKAATPLSDAAYTCTAVGECRPCPPDHVRSATNQVMYPYCRPYNNRQAVQCTSALSPTPLPGWSACGKFVGAEVQHYGQFLVGRRLTSA